MAQWDEFVSSSPEGSFYYRSSWLDIVRSAFGNEIEVYACVEDGALMCGCPLSVRSKGFIKIGRRPFATPYAGFILKRGQDDSRSRTAAAMSEHLAKEFNYVELVHTPAFHCGEAFQGRGWRRGCKHTYVLDLHDVNGLWSRFECDLRNIIRKAERNGIRVETSWDADRFYNLYKETFRIQGITISIGEAAIGILCRMLRERDCGQLFVAENEQGEACAAAIVTWDDVCAYYTLSASHPCYRTLGAPSLLLWEIIKVMAKRFHSFDFVGANIPSIAQFKKQFKPQLVAYETSENYSPRLFRYLYRGYAMLSDRLP